jgi:quercetin dioxygenase-like cupin family protein
MRELLPLNSTVGVGRFSVQTPWERHPDDDELLHILEGEVQLTVLNDDGPIEATVRAGSIFVVPRALWHRQLARTTATVLFMTGQTNVSTAEDPRREG